MQALQTLTFTYSATILLILAVGLVYLLHPERQDPVSRRLGRRHPDRLLWRVAFDGFSWYIASRGGLTLIHGSIAAVVVFLLWVYVSSVILMYGVEFTRRIRRLRRRRPDEDAGGADPSI